MAPLSDPGWQLTRTLLDVVLYTEQFCTGSGFPIYSVFWIIILSERKIEEEGTQERKKKDRDTKRERKKETKNLSLKLGHRM